MPLIRTDQRSIETRPEPEAHRRIVERLPAWLQREVDLADDFARIEASSTWAEWGCASVIEFGTRHGYRGAQVKGWVALGKAMREVPPLRAAVLEQRTPIEHAEIIAPLLLEPTLAEERDEWLDHAERMSARRLRSYVARRLEQIRQSEEDLEPLTIWTTRRARQDWRRTRDVACTRARRSLTDGEVLSEVVGHYLDDFDPLRRAARLDVLDDGWVAAAPAPGEPSAEPGTRTSRGPHRPGAGEPSGRARASDRSRHVPAATERKLWLRAGGVCEVPGCTSRRNLQMCHIRPFARGGGNGPWNLLLLCPRHHTLFDAGSLRFLRWTRGGRPTFKGPDGRILHPETRAPPPRLAAGPARRPGVGGP